MLKNNQRLNEETRRFIDSGALDYLLERMEVKLYNQWISTKPGEWIPTKPGGIVWEDIYHLQQAIKLLKTEILICIEHKDNEHGR